MSRIESVALIKVAHYPDWVPGACGLAFQLERLIYRIPPGAAVDRVDSDVIAPRTEFGGASAFDVVVDCAGRSTAEAQRTLRILFDGVPGEIGILAALLDDRPVCIAIEDSETPLEYATSRPALADRKGVTQPTE